MESYLAQLPRVQPEVARGGGHLAVTAQPEHAARGRLRGVQSYSEVLSVTVPMIDE